MKTNLIMFISAPLLMLGLSGCSVGSPVTGQSSNSSVSGTGGSGGNIGDPSIVAGNGGAVEGKGALSVPTADGLVARIQNGLESNVSALSGNFAKSLAQVKSNLPKTSDPTKATGFDQAQLLVYAACSDLTTGGTPLMKSKYNVDPKTNISTNQSALISAGVRMLDQYTAGLASQGPTSADVNKTFSTLVQQISSGAGNTTTIAFMSVCIAANTAGSTMMGF